MSPERPSYAPKESNVHYMTTRRQRRLIRTTLTTGEEEKRQDDEVTQDDREICMFMDKMGQAKTETRKLAILSAAGLKMPRDQILIMMDCILNAPDNVTVLQYCEENGIILEDPNKNNGVDFEDRPIKVSWNDDENGCISLNFGRDYEDF